MSREMPRTVAVLEAGVRSKLHVGAQLFVALNDVIAADIGIGLSAPGKPMKTDSMMTWLSCSKIAITIQFARIWQEGLVDLDDPVKLHLPEFSGGGKDAITIRHVWTHTCALLNVEQQLFPVRYNQSHAANIALVCATEIDPGVEPGTRAGYQTSVVALLLAEIAAGSAARLSGRCSRRGFLATRHERLVALECRLPPSITIETAWGKPSTRVALNQSQVHGHPTRRSISCISCLEATAVDQCESWRVYSCFCTDVARLSLADRADRTGFAFSVHAHMLRHACGYALANAGHDTRCIQDWLDHRSTAHTVRYTQLSAAPFKDFWR